MIGRYLVLSERIRAELAAMDHVVRRTESTLDRAVEQPENADLFLASAALDLHSFYTGVERLLELIARDVDQSVPSGPSWHRDLLAQSALPIAALRPAILRAETRDALSEYLGFRHVVRTAYSFDLRTDRVSELTADLPRVFGMTRDDLLMFADFLDRLSTSDQDNH
ncbi:MAG: hypothetical protein U0641_18005 [Anaerolineae bacterium]